MVEVQIEVRGLKGTLEDGLNQMGDVFQTS
jgi:hypothetical protein